MRCRMSIIEEQHVHEYMQERYDCTEMHGIWCSTIIYMISEVITSMNPRVWCWWSVLEMHTIEERSYLGLRPLWTQLLLYSFIISCPRWRWFSIQCRRDPPPLRGLSWWSMASCLNTLEKRLPTNAILFKMAQDWSYRLCIGTHHSLEHNTRRVQWHHLRGCSSSIKRMVIHARRPSNFWIILKIQRHNRDITYYWVSSEPLASWILFITCAGDDEYYVGRYLGSRQEGDHGVRAA